MESIEERCNKTKRVIANKIYKAKKGCIFDNNLLFKGSKQYDCYVPVISGELEIAKCIVCDSYGNVHPRFSDVAVPVHVDNLGRIIGEMTEEMYKKIDELNYNENDN